MVTIHCTRLVQRKETHTAAAGTLGKSWNSAEDFYWSELESKNSSVSLEGRSSKRSLVYLFIVSASSSPASTRQALCIANFTGCRFEGQGKADERRNKDMSCRRSETFPVLTIAFTHSLSALISCTFHFQQNLEDASLVNPCWVCSRHTGGMILIL